MAHRVAIWDPEGRLIADVVVPHSIDATLDGIWRAVPVAPLVLSVGAGYLIGGLNSVASTDRLAGGFLQQTVDPRITYVGSRFAPIGGGFSRPILPSAGINGLYGPSFNIVEVPEPDSWLLAIVVVCITIVRKQRG